MKHKNDQYCSAPWMCNESFCLLHRTALNEAKCLLSCLLVCKKCTTILFVDKKGIVAVSVPLPSATTSTCYYVYSSRLKFVRSIKSPPSRVGDMDQLSLNQLDSAVVVQGTCRKPNV